MDQPTEARPESSVAFRTSPQTTMLDLALSTVHVFSTQNRKGLEAPHQASSQTVVFLEATAEQSTETKQKQNRLTLLKY